MPETSFNGRSTRTARNVRKSNELSFLILIVAKLKPCQTTKINNIKKKTRAKNRDILCITYPVTTTIKSITFQRLLRYEPSCSIKPRAIILSAASKQKIPIK